MAITQLLGSMCADLPDADLNAIRKARGFSAKETASRDSFASFFVSSIGVQEGMSRLSQDEVTALHLLHRIGEVEIAFFERLYGSAAQAGKYYYGTYTQQYRPTFDAVKKNLVRKGLLIMAETRQRGETVQMERWRFALPREFAAYLPPVLDTHKFDQPCETSERTIRKSLLHLLTSKAQAGGQTDVRLKDASIYLGNQPFTLANLLEWQVRTWQASDSSLSQSVAHSLPPAVAVRTLLTDLAADEWVGEKALGPVLRIFSYGYKIPPLEKFMKQGWELGILSRLLQDSILYYRMAPTPTPEDQKELPFPLPWLQISPALDEAIIDLQQIPLHWLEQLNSLVALSVEEGTLLARSDLAKLSRTDLAARQSSAASWLAEHLPSFKVHLHQVHERWGKTLLHQNLLIARVRDLSLRVQLERELGANLLVLNEHFIAFPPDLRSSVERVLKKSGFVTKIVKA